MNQLTTSWQKPINMHIFYISLKTHYTTELKQRDLHYILLKSADSMRLLFHTE